MHQLDFLIAVLIGYFRFNHFVPAIGRTDQEKQRFINKCAAKEMFVCNFEEERKGLTGCSARTVTGGITPTACLTRHQR